MTTASIDDIDQHVSALSLASKERPLTKQDAKARLDIYARALRDVTKADLARGTDDLLRSVTFMPTPAEILKAANRYAAKREFAHFRAREILRAHAKWEPPLKDEDRATPEDIAAIKQQVAARFASNRCDTVAERGEKQ